MPAYKFRVNGAVVSVDSYGAGEAAAAPAAAAVANAVFDATSVRLRSAPFRAERLKAALAKA